MATAVAFALQRLVDLVEDCYVSSSQAALLREEVRALLDEVRPDAVALVDAWNFPDTTLASAIGRADGRVYEALFELVRTAPSIPHAAACATARGCSRAVEHSPLPLVEPPHRLNASP